MKPQEAFERLVLRAQRDGFLSSSPVEWHVQRALRTGQTIPDKYLPGRLVMAASPEVREALQHLTANMTQHRQSW